MISSKYALTDRGNEAVNLRAVSEPHARTLLTGRHGADEAVESVEK